MGGGGRLGARWGCGRADPPQPPLADNNGAAGAAPPLIYPASRDGHASLASLPPHRPHRGAGWESESRWRERAARPRSTSGNVVRKLCVCVGGGGGPVPLAPTGTQLRVLGELHPLQGWGRA